MYERFEEAREMVKKYNQEHLLKFYHLFNQDDKDLLINEILAINFELIQSTYNEMKNKQVNEKIYELKPLMAKKLKLYSKKEKEKFYRIGINAISEGRVADPYFIGFTICSNHPAASKVVEKKSSRR